MAEIENKNCFFKLHIQVPEEDRNNAFYKERVKNSIDLVLASMGVYEQIKEFERKDKILTILLFQPKQRKRKGQLVKFCHRYLPDDTHYEVKSLLKDEFNEIKWKLTNNKNYINHNITTETEYNGKDILVLDDRNNWFPWQKEIFPKFFNNDLSLKSPEARTIHSLVDIEGQSIFYKWLMVRVGEKHIGRITFGTAGQLRTIMNELNLGHFGHKTHIKTV